MSQPLIKYTLTKAGRQPEWLSKDSRAFKGEHSAPANKPGKLPRFGSPQDTIYLGIGAGDPDSDGTPDGYVGTIASKADLQTYITEVGTAAGYKVITPTVTGVSTSVTTGLSTAWDADPYAGGLSTTTSTKHTASGVGTVMTLTGSQVIKVVTEVDNGSGITTSTVDTPVVLDPASTKSNVSTSVGVVTTTSSPGPDPVGVTTTVTTTTTESYTYTDVVTSTSTSKSETTTDGITTRTDTVTTTEMTNYETSYDYAAEATRLWDIHEAINA
jgi:hypothetical protein